MNNHEPQLVDNEVLNALMVLHAHGAASLMEKVESNGRVADAWEKRYEGQAKNGEKVLNDYDRITNALAEFVKDLETKLNSPHTSYTPKERKLLHLIHGRLVDIYEPRD